MGGELANFKPKRTTLDCATVSQIGSNKKARRSCTSKRQAWTRYIYTSAAWAALNGNAMVTPDDDGITTVADGNSATEAQQEK